MEGAATTFEFWKKLPLNKHFDIHHLFLSLYNDSGSEYYIRNHFLVLLEHIVVAKRNLRSNTRNVVKALFRNGITRSNPC